MNTLFVANGNDGQLGQISLFVDSLRDKNKGNYSGDILIISTALSENVQQHLKSRGIKICSSPLPEITENWSFRHKIIAFEMAQAKGGWLRCFLRSGSKGSFRKKISDWLFRADIYALVFARRFFPKLRQKMEAGFDLWHRKHFSKFVLFNYFKQGGEVPDKIVMCDADMIFQRDVAALLDGILPGVVYYGDEVEPMLPASQGGSPVYESNEWAIEHNFPHAKLLSMGSNTHEANVGFFCGDGATIVQMMNRWRELIFAESLRELLVCERLAFWHEQDFFRLLRDMKEIPFQAVGTDVIVHACHKGSDLIERNPEGVFVKKDTQVAPVIVHFAGGVWRRYADIAAIYTSPPAKILSENKL